MHSLQKFENFNMELLTMYYKDIILYVVNICNIHSSFCTAKYLSGGKDTDDMANHALLLYIEHNIYKYTAYNLARTQQMHFSIITSNVHSLLNHLYTITQITLEIPYNVDNSITSHLLYKFSSHRYTLIFLKLK